ncbi:MAG: riboflavin synthase [Actinomycetota bacterium]
MFTGIVEERGRVIEAGDARIVIEASVVDADADVGASIAVNGVCLTVVEHTGDKLTFDVSPETRSRTTLGELRDGDPVNLERPVTLTTRLGGHLVQGHVDAVGDVRSIGPGEGGGSTLTVAIPGDLRRYVVEKGSITVDGISLTVAGLTEDAFSVALIPHTLAVTTLGATSPGDHVNLEVDVIARYAESLLENGERT